MSINGYKVYEISKEGHVQHLIDGRRIWGKDKIIGEKIFSNSWLCIVDVMGSRYGRKYEKGIELEIDPNLEEVVKALEGPYGLKTTTSNKLYFAPMNITSQLVCMRYDLMTALADIQFTRHEGLKE